MLELQNGSTPLGDASAAQLPSFRTGLPDASAQPLLDLGQGAAAGLAAPQQLPEPTSQPLSLEPQAVETAASSSSSLVFTALSSKADGADAVSPKDDTDSLVGLILDGAIANPTVSPQNDSLPTATNLGVLIGNRAIAGSVTASDELDFYQFQLDAVSDIHLMLADMSSDADLYLIWDRNQNGQVDSGEVLDGSEQVGASVDVLTFNNLGQGEYYIAVSQYSGATNYSLYSSASPDGGIVHHDGTLRADQFALSRTNAYTVISGNGNVDFGQGYADVLNLSNISVNAVSQLNLATATGGGVLYNTGNGMRVFDAMSLSNGQQILMEGLDGIQFLEGYYSLNSGILPNDPLFQEQWNLHMMGVHSAWRFTQGSSEVLVGVQDTGLGMTSSGRLHPDLVASRTYGYTNNMGDDFSDGDSSHGTAVQGIIAGASNNGIGMSGINWYSDVVNLDVLGGDSSDFDLDEATQIMTEYAQSTGRRLVVNMSLGVHGPSEGHMPGLEQLIAQNINNALFVIAAGNDDEGFLSYPATLSQSYSNVISVGASWGTQDWYGNATDPGDRITYDGWWGSNFGYGLSLMGPSEVITTEASLDAGFTYNLNAGTSSTRVPFNGTSAAAPNVAGVASLVWSANPNLSATEVHTILRETAYDLGFNGYDYEYGAGFVNADAAVRRAMAIAGTPLRQQSAQQGLSALVAGLLPSFSGNPTGVMVPAAAIAVEAAIAVALEAAPTSDRTEPSISFEPLMQSSLFTRAVQAEDSGSAPGSDWVAAEVGTEAGESALSWAAKAVYAAEDALFSNDSLFAAIDQLPWSTDLLSGDLLSGGVLAAA